MGLGVDKDPVQAWMWFSLAVATYPDKDTMGSQDRITKILTPDQLTKAKRLVREWKPTPE